LIKNIEKEGKNFAGAIEFGCIVYDSPKHIEIIKIH
jgi:hypothetical protein